MLKKIPLLIFLPLLLVSAYSYADTIVGSDITTDTTWNLAGSPYIITTDITIFSGVTLTIQPNVVVKFAGYYQLTVNGALNAQGTAGNLITFTSNNAAPVVNDWSGLYFDDNSVDASCVLSYVQIKYAYQGVFLNSASPTITNNILTNNQNGISLMGSVADYPAPNLTNNSIYNNTYSDLSAGGSGDVSVMPPISQGDFK